MAASDLQAPKQIIERNNEIYVTDWGTSHQVKVFNAASGKEVRVIGKAGGPQLGDYDEQRMAHPLGMCVDSNGVLWVAEEDYLPKRISRWDAKTGRFINAWYGPTQYGGGGFVDPKDKSRAYYPSIGNPGSMGLLEFKVDLKTGESKLTGVRYRYPDPLNDIVSYGGYPTKPIFFPTDMIPVGSHGGITPGQTFYFKGTSVLHRFLQYVLVQSVAGHHLWILENGVCRPIASSGWVGSGPHHWATLDEPEIKKKMPSGPVNSIFFVWTDRNHDHAVQPDEVEFIRPKVAGSEGIVFQPDLSVISGGPYLLPTSDVDEMGVPSYNLNRLQLVSSYRRQGRRGDGSRRMVCCGLTGFQDGQPRWTLATRDTKSPPAGYGELEDPKRMLGYPVKSTRGEAGYFVARYSYMGEIYIYSVDGILITTLGADTRLAPLWPYPEQKLGMAIKGLSFDAEQFWPFMFGLDDGNVYLSVGKWHSSIVRLDGLDKVRRIDLGEVNATAEMIAAAAPARVEEASKNAIRDEISVPPIQAKIDGDLSEWPAKGWATINPKCSFQLGMERDKLVVAYKTDQSQMLLNSATEFPFAFTQGGGFDLMLRTSGSGDDKKPEVGDIRLFVTKKERKGPGSTLSTENHWQWKPANICLTRRRGDLR